MGPVIFTCRLMRCLYFSDNLLDVIFYDLESIRNGFRTKVSVFAIAFCYNELRWSLLKLSC